MRTHTGLHTDPAFDTQGILDDVEKIEDDIEYSLNKQRRWELPKIIEELVLLGQDDDQYNFQLVQRHCVFRIANCISVAASNGIFVGGRRIANCRLYRARDSRRFFQSNSVLMGKESQRGHELPGHQQEREEDPANDEDEAPFIRYEVHFPTSNTSYLAHDRKFIGTFKRKSRAQRKYENKGRKQIKRLHFHHVIQDTLGELKEDETVTEEVGRDDRSETENKISTYQLYLEDFIKRSDLTEVHQRKRKIRSCKSSSKSQRKEMTIRPQLVCIGKDYSIDVSSQSEEPLIQKQATITKQPRLDMQPVKVILHKNRTTREHLLEHYGADYIEAHSHPRRFLIDISGRVRPSERACAFLVFISDVDSKMNTVTHSVFDVLVNAWLPSEVLEVKLKTNYVYTATNIDKLIKTAQLCIESLPNIDFVTKTNFVETKRKRLSLVEKFANWSTKSYHADNAFLIEYLLNQREQDNLLANSLDSEVISHPNIGASEMPDVASPGGQFCAICFEGLGQQSGTALMSCSHWFCDNCWKEYLYTQIERGDIKLQCPEYGCKQIVDAGTLLSLAGIRDALQFARHHHDNQVQVQTDRKWCPNKNCDRAVKVNLESVGFAHCVCGEKFCMRCDGMPSWPAPCEAVKNYHRKLRVTGDIRLLPHELSETSVVNGKNCPSCNRFVEKSGGCPYMVCICGAAFCWGCGKLWRLKRHGSFCYKNGYNDKFGTHPLLIKPAQIEDKEREQWYKRAVRHRLNRHPNRLSKMKSKIQDLAMKLQNYIVKSQRKGNIIKVDFDIEDKVFTSETDKISDWLRDTLDMYVEVNHIVENTSLLLGLKQLPSKSGRRVQYVNNRLAYFTEVINGLLMNGTAITPARDFLIYLTDVRSQTEQNIKSLIKVLK